MPASPSAPVGTVLVLSSSDLAALGDQLVAAVIGREVSRRLPGWRCDHWAPLGRTRPAVTDGGLGAAALPGHDDRSVLRIAAAGHVGVVCPTFPVGITGAELADRYGLSAAADATPWFGAGLPATDMATCWTAVRVAAADPALVAAANRLSLLAVRDRASRDRLVDAGVSTDIAVVPHPGLLAGGLITPEVLTNRRDVLRQLGLLPRAGAYAVLHLAGPPPDGLAAAVAEIAVRAGADQIVLLPDAPVSGDWPGFQVLPADLVLADRLAVLSGATAAVTTDEHGAAACAGLGVPWVALDPDDRDRPVIREFGAAQRIARRPADLVAAFDADQEPANPVALRGFLDRLAELADRVAADRPLAPRQLTALAEENAALRAAADRLRARLLLERQRLADPLADALSTRDAAVAEVAELTARLAAAQAELVGARRELAAWRDTKLVRWSMPLRHAYGRIRRP